MTPFELRSLPDRKKRRIFLVQLPYKTNVISEVAVPTTLSAIDGAPLEAASVLLLELVGEKVVEPAGAAGASADPLDRPFTVAISEESALRLGLLFAAINSLRSEDRIQEIISGVQSLDATQAGFWLNGISADQSGNMLKAFRVAMTGEA